MLHPPLAKIRQWLFLSFLFLLTIGTRKIFNFPAIETLPGFRENLSFSFFLFEIPLLIGFFWELFLFWKNPTSFKNLFSKKRGSLEKYLLFFLLLIIGSFLFHASLINLYALWRLTEAVGLFFWVRKLVTSSDKLFFKALPVIFVSGILQSFLAFFQFLFQKSLGLYWLGESHLGAQILGVAKLELENQKFIRAYGTFPHPNLLGAFLFLSLVSGIWLILNSQKSRPIYFSGSFFILSGIFFSFSRSVWLATFLLLVLFFFLKFCQAHPDEGSSFSKNRLWLALFVFFSLLLLTFSPFLKTRLCFSCQNDQSFSWRERYTQSAQKIIFQHPLAGIGLGNFTLLLPKTDPQLISQPWEIQPVHNLFLLATAELGLLVLIFFLGIFWLTLISFWRNQNIFSLLFLFFLFLGFFDHYFWTLAQGQLLFFLALAFSAYSSKIRKETSVI